MSKRTLQQAFNSVFHDDNLFKDFLSLSLDDEIESFVIGSRSVIKTSDKLKKYLRFIDRVILRNLNTNHEVVHSYVKGKSSITAVAGHAKSKYFFTTDIENFFPSITRKHVDLVLKSSVENIPISDFENHLDHIASLLVWKGTIPIGFPTSPQLSNAVLYEFDNKFQNHCMEIGLIYSRYSDDLIVSTDMSEKLQGIEGVVQACLDSCSQAAFQLKNDKTRFLHMGNKIRLLGLVITTDGRVTIDVKYKKRLESLLYFYVNDKVRFHDYLTHKLKINKRSLFGLLHYANSVDPHYLNKLQKKYGSYALGSLMEDQWRD
jgi:RNA-directed DNA polymerase